jgi:hypothetical protein
MASSRISQCETHANSPIHDDDDLSHTQNKDSHSILHEESPQGNCSISSVCMILHALTSIWTAEWPYPSTGWGKSQRDGSTPTCLARGMGEADGWESRSRGGQAGASGSGGAGGSEPGLGRRCTPLLPCRSRQSRGGRERAVAGASSRTAECSTAALHGINPKIEIQGPQTRIDSYVGGFL